MRIAVCVRAVLATALVGAVCAPASAQMYEAVGTRAQGMAGAFVAVADDATATWWNPAGIATGAYFDVVLEHGQLTNRPVTDSVPNPGSNSVPNSVPDPGLRTKASGFAMVFPALGLSYYRLRVSEIAPVSTTEAGNPGRQDPGAAASARSLAVHQFGATVAQSAGEHLVIATTVKLVRAGVESGVATADDPLGAADDLAVRLGTRADLDAGAMVSAGLFRIGMSVRNIREPKFGEGDHAVTLKRKARAGMAVVTGQKWLFDALTIAGDTDLTKTTTVFGEMRHVAGGGEAWLLRRHLGVRAGMSASTIGERRPATSLGISLAAITGIYVEAARTTGKDESVKGWSTSIRVTF